MKLQCRHFFYGDIRRFVSRQIHISFFVSHFFSLFSNRRRIGLTVFLMGAIFYLTFLSVFSLYLYCKSDISKVSLTSIAINLVPKSCFNFNVKA